MGGCVINRELSPYVRGPAAATPQTTASNFRLTELECGGLSADAVRVLSDVADAGQSRGVHVPGHAHGTNFLII
jgi:hypothetical protein